MELKAVELVGRHVRLVPLLERDREELRRAASDDRIWEFSTVDTRGAAFDAYFDGALPAVRDGAPQVAFGVRLVADGRLVGSTRFINVSPRHRTAEIGYTWYAPDAWGTAVNPECKLLLLGHAFAAGANRVEFCVDALNRRSQAAVAKLGAVREGVLRSHLVVWTGRVRDSVLFS